MLDFKYLTETHLNGFDRYKYNSMDTNYLSIYIMHPFWNWCVQFFPLWLAPNLITFIGFAMNVLIFLLIAYYDWDFTAANNPINTVPLWVWPVSAIGIFVAYTLDGIDGKQARRTGTSGPLGELFDHGLDSFSTVLIPIYIFSMFGTEHLPPHRMYFVMLLVFQNFYLAHFEKYNTGVLYLPWGYDYTMWAVILALLVSTIVGPEMWRNQMPFGLTVAHYVEIVMWLSSLLSNHPIIARNIYRSYKNRTGKMYSFMEGARPLFPVFWLVTISYIWLKYSHNQILTLEPRIVFILMGSIFSNISCRLIVAQMSDTRADSFNILMWPLCLVALISSFPFCSLLNINLPVNIERWMLHALTIFTMVAHIHYSQGIVNEMCDYFHIKCFKVSRHNIINSPPETA